MMVLEIIYMFIIRKDFKKIRYTMKEAPRIGLEFFKEIVSLDNI